MCEIVDDLAATAARPWRPDGIDLIVPHQANERMIREIALAAGIADEHLYFNVAHVGNLGGASIPIALHDAIVDGTIAEESRILTPAFAAGALAGFARITLRAGVAVTSTRTSSTASVNRVPLANQRAGQVAKAAPRPRPGGSRRTVISVTGSAGET
jgi:3-hydroxy-3-methylglutaryl CoA synthase